MLPSLFYKFFLPLAQFIIASAASSPSQIILHSKPKANSEISHLSTTRISSAKVALTDVFSGVTELQYVIHVYTLDKADRIRWMGKIGGI